MPIYCHCLSEHLALQHWWCQLQYPKWTQCVYQSLWYDNDYAAIYHYGDVIIGAIATQITSLTIVYSTVYSDADQRKHQSSASLAFVWGIHRGPVNSPHKWPVTWKMFPFDDVIMQCAKWTQCEWKMTMLHLEHNCIISGPNVLNLQKLSLKKTPRFRATKYKHSSKLISTTASVSHVF